MELVLPVALHVRGAADPGAARRGLRAARRAIEPLAAGAATISAVVSAPGGPLMVVTPQPGAETTIDTDVLLTTVRDRIVEANEPRAQIVTVDLGGRLDALDATPDAVVLRLFGLPAGPDTEVPIGWLDVAADWVLGDLSALDTVHVRILGVEFEVPAPDVAHVLHDALEARAWCDVVQGDLDDRIRTASLTFGPLPHLALAGGGPGAGRRGLLSRFTALRDASRELAGTSTWACLSFDRDFGHVATGLADLLPPPFAWPNRGGAPPNAVAAWLVDRHVPGVYAHQVLSPGHLQTLGHTPVGAETLGDHRVELAVGEAEDWLDGEVPVAAYEGALDELGSLLVRDEQLDDLIAARSTTDEPSAPSLDAIVLEASPHRRRSNRLTLLELVAWIDGQPHTDHPARVSVPLGAFARWLSVGFDAVQRQRLRALAPAIVASAASPPVERTRAWAITRWLVEVETATWLRRAGLGEVADQIAQLDVTDARGLAEASAALADAAVTCHRRLVHEGGHEDLAWEVWEAISGPAGWLAAAEAAVADAPGDVSAAAEQRVVEVVRSQASGAAPVDPGALANEVWSVTLGALADHLWTEAWHAADAVASAEANTDLLGPALGTRPEIWDTLSEADRAAAAAAAHDAARGPLARIGLAVGEATDEHPWDLGMQAASEAQHAATWQSEIDAARAQAGEEVWTRAMAAARARIDESTGWAPDIVARARLVAVAREASGAAARLAASAELARTIASHGANVSHDKCVDRSIDALLPATERLGRGAADLLQRLLAGRQPAARRPVLRRRTGGASSARSVERGDEVGDQVVNTLEADGQP